MSYDLYLSSPQLDKIAFDKYFEDRPHYQEAGWYTNEDTGVYFSFVFCDPGAEEVDPDAPEILRTAHVAFNLNYVRPHVFGLEAEPEVSAFVAAFDCIIHDPQTSGMGDGPYSAEGFLTGWNKGNAFGHQVIRASSSPPDLLVFDDSAIERVWHWNRHRSAAQRFVDESYFLPRVNWAKRKSDGVAIAYGVWGEGIATAFPQCATHVMLARKRRRQLPRPIRKQGSAFEGRLLSIGEIAKLDGYAWRADDLDRALLAPLQVAPTDAMLAAFEGQFAGVETLIEPFTFDQVVDASLAVGGSR